MDCQKTCQSITHFKTMAYLKYLVIVVCLLLVTFSSCDNGGEPSTTDNNKDREEILIHWVDNIIKPSYSTFKTKLDVMIVSANAFTSSPEISTLNDFRNAWEEAYIEWQRVELFEFGAADQLTARNFFNIYPTNVSQINTYINDPGLSLDVPAAYAVQGFPAIDYMLNGIAVDDAATVAAYTSDTDAAKRIAYLSKLVARMDTVLTSIIEIWNSSYRDTFISKTGLDIGSSTGNVVNAYVLEYERYVRSGKIGIPSGIFSSGVVQPEKVEAFYKKDISKSLALAANQAARDFFNGKNPSTGQNGPSFKSYLDALGAKDDVSGAMLSTVIDDQFEIVTNSLNGLSQDFTAQIQNDNSAMTDTYTDMQKLVRLLKLDMTSAMSVTITYTDNDGD
jgi:predicted lipoprotein